MSGKVSDKTWIIIPARNESKYLKKVLTKLHKITDRVIVIDDGSGDDTAKQAALLATYVLRHKINLGKGAALRTACDFAFQELHAVAIVMLDGDDQHEAAEVKLFLQQLDAGQQVVFGVRAEPANMNWIKLKINRLSSFIMYLLFGEYILDIPSGFKAMTRSAYQKLRWQASDYSVEVEIAAKTAKYKLAHVTVPISTIYHDTDKGLTAFDVLKSVRYLMKLRVTL